MPNQQEQQKHIDDLIIRIREHGFRLTPQRMAVIKALIRSNEHLSAEEIFERVHSEYPMMGLATVYKTVALLKEMGEIVELNFSNQLSRYEVLDIPPHPHFICSQCNAIIDLDHKILDSLPESISRRTGHKIVKTRLDFFGFCQDCQSGKM